MGSYVYFYRAQAQPGTSRNYRWQGPARVIGLELRNHRRAEDPEPATDGGQPHNYWLRYGPTVVLVTGEQLRFASEDELLAAHSVPQEALEPPYARGARNFVDLRPPVGQRQFPLADPEPQPALPQGATSTTAIGSSSASALIPGTDIPVMPGLLPPVPEGQDDGGLLDAVGSSDFHEPDRHQRTGEATQDMQVDARGSSDFHEPDRRQRTGEATVQQPDSEMSRRTSEVEPEPQPVIPQSQLPPELQRPAQQPAQLPPLPQSHPTSAGNVVNRGDPDRLDGYHPVGRGRRAQEMPYLAEGQSSMDGVDGWDCPTLPRTLKDKVQGDRKQARLRERSKF